MLAHPHPVTLDHGPASDRSISVDSRTDLKGLPLSSGRAGRGLRATVALGALIVAAGLGLWAYNNITATRVRPPVVPPPSVAVATPVQANVAERTNLTGQFSAVNQVVLRAQVSGYLTEIHFRDGQIVHKGDLLFVIDPRPYEVQLEQANAQFQTASATVALANKQLDRSARLNRVAVESEERLDETTQSQRVAAAAVKAAEAAIHAALLNIEFTHIVAPFSGRVGRRHVSIGSLITGGTAVIFGMLGVTLFGLLFTPTFYAVVRQLSGNAPSQKGKIYGPNPQPEYGPQQPGALRQRANAGRSRL